MNACTSCHFPLNPRYTGKISREEITNGPENMFRYGQLLPVSAPSSDSILFKVGCTPLYMAEDLARETGISGKLYLKIEKGKLTKTFKDRGTAIAGEFAVERNSAVEKNSNEPAYKFLGGTSTGNLASSIAAVAQAIGLNSIVIVHGAAEEKLIKKTLQYGAYVIKVEGSYSKVNSLVNSVVTFNDRLNSEVAWVNINLRPVYSQGSKTIGFEIAEQLGWKAPENIVGPVAAGLSLWQYYLALQELKQFSLIDSLETRMHAVQTARCAPVVNAWNKKTFEIESIRNPEKSIAETLSVGDPSNGYQVLQVLKESNGSAVAVSEEEILFGMKLICDNTDYKIGPVGGAVIAGLKKLVERGMINSNEITVAVLTDAYDSGSNSDTGLSTGKLFEVEPKRDAINRALEDILDGKYKS